MTTAEDQYEAEYVIIATAGMKDYLEPLDIEFKEGKEGSYWMDRHVATDEDNRVMDGLYAAGLARYWVYQTAFALGDGTKAAINVLSDIRGEPFQDHDT